MLIGASTTTLPLHLVIADDNAAHIEAIRRAFEDEGAQVVIHAVGTLRAYRAYIAERPPDLALLDLNLPDGRAVDVLSYPPEDAPFPVLVMTAFGSQPIVVEVMKAGALDYIVKSPEAFADMPHTAERILREWTLRQSHKQAEQALFVAKQSYRDLFEQSRDGIVVMDLDGKVCDANRRYADMLGYTPDEVRQLHVWDWDIQWTQEQFRGMFTTADATGASIETRYRRKDGSFFDVEISSNLVNMGGQNVIFCIYRDVTMRKMAQVASAALEEQLSQQQRLETVGQLAAGIAHDFNNLLTGISGFTLLVHDAAPEGSSTRDDLAEVLKLCKRAADLIHQLLAFSRRQPLHPVMLNINETITELSKMLQRLLDAHLAVTYDLSTPLHMVQVDPGQFEQVLVNLAINARDAMPDGGQLTIATGNVVLDETYAASHVGVTPGVYVLLAVTDTGSGMGASVMEHIFEPFFTTKGIGKGTGLGLATVYGIIKQHGGHIRVESTPGHGTTFNVYWPASPEDADTPACAVNTVMPSAAATQRRI